MDEKIIINKSDHDTDSEIEIDEEGKHADLDVDFESFEDHDNNDDILWKLD